VGGAPPEAVALAGALGDEHHLPAAAAARRWLGELRHVRLEISGDDLLAAGIPAGPEVGRRLERALERKLDGELADGREWELDAALEGS
jgi:tRNA nucleotidyltransferase (CCA-adding enzyme)